MGSIGAPEILVVALIALLLFGAGRIADIGKGLGQGIKNFKQGIKEADEDEADEADKKSAKKKSSKEDDDEKPAVKKRVAKDDEGEDDDEEPEVKVTKKGAT